MRHCGRCSEVEHRATRPTVPRCARVRPIRVGWRRGGFDAGGEDGATGALNAVLYLNLMSTDGPTAPRALRLLIVEDDEDIAHLLAHSVRKAGFEAAMLSGAGVLARLR